MKEIILLYHIADIGALGPEVFQTSLAIDREWSMPDGFCYVLVGPSSIPCKRNLETKLQLFFGIVAVLSTHNCELAVDVVTAVLLRTFRPMGWSRYRLLLDPEEKLPTEENEDLPLPELNPELPLLIEVELADLRISDPRFSASA